MRRHAAHYTFCALTLASCLLAGVVSAQEYRLGPQDQLSIKIYEWPDLTGEFTVGASGSISLPLLGDVPAAELTPQELAQEIGRRLQANSGLSETPGASVEVAQYRPFFILGDVQTPGEYPFRPGLNVLQAVSIGGGHFRYTDPNFLRLDRDAIAARGDLRVLANQVEQYQVRRARLQAEVEQAETITFPPEITARTDDPDIARLIREEEMLFASRAETLAEQIQTLEGLVELYEAEIVSLQAQLETEQRQGAIIQEELENVRSLVERGIAPAPRQFTLERSAAEIEREQREIETYIVRARQNISQSRRDMISLRSERRNDTIAELQQVQADLEEAGERVSTTQRLIFEAEVIAPTERADQQLAERSPATYSIIRRDASGEAEEIEATETTSVLPGDVVQVQRRLRQSIPSPGQERSAEIDLPGFAVVTGSTPVGETVETGQEADPTGQNREAP